MTQPQSGFAIGNVVPRLVKDTPVYRHIEPIIGEIEGPAILASTRTLLTVVEENGDVFRDTVNIAARMAALAKGMQIMTTRRTVDALPPTLRGSTQAAETSSCVVQNSTIGLGSFASSDAAI